jgi:hypothetical protein
MLFALTACKTTECYTLHTNTFIIQDTIELHAIHHHYETLEGEPRCAYVPSSRIPYIDTIHTEIWERVPKKSFF